MNAKVPYLPAATAIAIALSCVACEREQPAETVATAPVEERPSHLNIRPAEGAVEPTDAAVAQAQQQLRQGAKALRDRWAGKTFEEFEAAMYREPGNGKYIIDGDVPIPDRKHLREYFDALQREIAGAAGGKLVVGMIGGNGSDGTELAVVQKLRNGSPDIWNAARKKQLTYCVSTAFGPRHATVVADMAAAARAWEEAADVDFIHVPAQDAACTATNPNVMFDVRPVDVEGRYLARAFFPADARPSRNVLIDATSFELNPAANLKLVGILRHELGHALGWRHEHTRPEAGTCFEDMLFTPLTSYDRFSVMHYPQCNGGGDSSLALTALDKIGSACIYGRGSNNTENLGQCLFTMPTVASGTVADQTIAGQSVTEGAMKHHPVIAVKPGSLLEVRMSGTGDPDLYVRFSRKPTLRDWVCRPYLDGAEEVCDLQVPASRSTAFIAVHGYTAATYNLSIKYVRQE
jgi:hypothetical protein